VKVALVSRELAPFYGGGIGTYVSEMAAVLAAAGHEVHIITGPHDGVLSRGPAIRPGVRFHCVDLETGDAGLDAYPAYPMRYAMAVYQTLRQLWAKGGFDYIEFPDYHAEGYFAIRAKRTLGDFAGAVLAVRLHSTSWVCREADRDQRLNLELAYIEHMERSAVAEADTVVAPGQRVMEKVVGDRGPRRARREIIPLPVDVDRLIREMGAESRITPRSAAPDPTGQEPEVLFFGKLQHLKGPQDLVAAALLLLARGAQARFRFIGNDSGTGPLGASMLGHLKSRIPAQFQSRITFDPGRPRSELGKAIRAATVVCFPSRWEAFPMVCLEALALGAPVVASDAGGMGEIIQDGVSGVLFPPGDAAAMADALERVLNDAALRSRLSEAGPKRVRELCDPARVAAMVENLVKSALAELAESAETTQRNHAQVDQRPHPSSPPNSAPSAPLREPHPLISILIPYYNLGRYLPQTLASVRAQTFKDYEIVLIDDGSTDPDSIALLDRLGPDIRIIRKPNGGLSSTRNAGLEAARGRWVVPLDADDLIEPTLLENLLAAANRDPGLSYISPLVSYFVDDPAKPTGGWVPLGPDRDLLIAQNVGGAASGSLIDRAAALEIGGYDQWLTSYEDWEFWCRMAMAGKRGTVIPRFAMRYRVRADSMYRTVALERHAALHAYIIAKHPTLAADPSRAMRLLASLGDKPDPAAAARAIINENLRYRVVDKMNAVLKRTGLQGHLKGAAIKALRTKQKPQQ